MTKKAHIKAYLTLLLQEGTFRGAKTPTDVFARACAAFTKDLGEVVSEMAQQFGASGMASITAKLAEVGGQVVANFAERAFKRMKGG
jgi:hypothetical protein